MIFAFRIGRATWFTALWLGVWLAYACGVAGSQPLTLSVGGKFLDGHGKNVKIQAGSLYVNGQPVLLRGLGVYKFAEFTPAIWEQDMRKWSVIGLNFVEVFTTPGYADQFGAFLDLAEKEGIYVVARVDNSLRDMTFEEGKQVLLPFMQHAGKPALVAWLLRDDTRFRQHSRYLIDIENFVRQYDPVTPVTTTLIDSRSPEGLSSVEWEAMASIVDFTIPYWYAVFHDGITYDTRTFKPLPGSKGGLDDLQLLAEYTRAQWPRENPYLWTWVQSHTEYFMQDLMGMKRTEHYTATADQMRIETYQTLMAGYKGLLYYRHDVFVPERMGVSRNYELPLLWGVLGCVDEFLANGERKVLQRPVGDGVEAVSFRLGNDQLVLLAQHRYDDLRYVGEGVLSAMELIVPTSGGQAAEELQAYLLDNGGVAQLPTKQQPGALVVQLPALDLTGTVLITRNTALVESVAAKITARLAEAAQASLYVFGDTLAKVEGVSAGLPQSAATESALAEARQAFSRGLERLRSKQWLAAYNEGRNGREPLRQVAKAQIAAGLAKATTDLALMKYTLSYFALPSLYKAGYEADLALNIRARVAQTSSFVSDAVAK